ncbi:response regulator transcription factor [Methanospirillum sp.]|uniref:response regulator transcription factor n=1 Tax=Methanospirillum sp. TaxID=45200 RepID=UPI002983FAF6|nr:response regulator [Methanospirillum sp.]
MTTVLMVDDNPADIDDMNKILTKAGFFTLTQPDGIHILDFLRENSADLIMLDLVMPKINGIEVLREIKVEFPDIPVIMCSAAGLEQVVALALRVGAAGYVVKPYHEQELLDSIRKVTGKK